MNIFSGNNTNYCSFLPASRCDNVSTQTLACVPFWTCVALRWHLNILFHIFKGLTTQNEEIILNKFVFSVSKIYQMYSQQPLITIIYEKFK